MTLFALDDVKPTIEESAWVAHDANVIGQVILGAKASVWFGATLRGDNEPITVGDGTNIQENVVCHTDPGCPLTIGAGCTIGHKVMLHGCIIGENTLIGMGATILNGAKIGKNCLIGAGALVTEDKEIPDGSLVMGMPGKIVRELDAQAIQMLQASALKYQENAARFRDGLKPV
ncbi:gamma carbonic anhydrase family protein [Roseivivax sp. THAF30]|uniref:gamma carbonic anhydrase family protein n=1 Tax=Roseivivax sp. THAF30 TaxID=2587852 RepID=UPI001268CD31|nr:gamma carbonic anhydrase family protein [Roseivivax sp. THAF30]QFT63128.1 2,3,4,5-tetrahydropyridine-2,6-dicarboxylate N-acetyltransferase [Roseivivax sp. THAF30]